MRGTNRIFLLAVLALALGLGLGAREAFAGASINMPGDAWLTINYEMQLFGQWRDTGSGPDNDENTTDIYFRRNRLSLRGQVTKTYGFYYAVEHQGDRLIDDIEVRDDPIDRFTVLDAFLLANWSNAFQMRAGLTKDILVREHNEGCFFPLSLDRSLFVYTPLRRVSRDYGVVLWGNLVDDKVQYKLAAMKGIDSSDSPKSNLRYSARVHLSLLEPENLPLYFGTYLGRKKVLTVGAGYQVEPDAVYSDIGARSGASDYQAWTYDIYAEYPTEAGTFTASAAYLETDFDEAYKGGDPDPFAVGIDGEKNGWYVKAGYLLPKPVGPGQLQFFGRVEQWEFAQLQSVFDQEIDWWSIGLNYYLKGHDLRLTLEYAVNDFDKESATVKDFDTVTAMLQFRF
ncbi:MAG: selenite/tellurite reduction operon porin ExtI [Thermodesulfovibrionales bacterium]